MELLAYLATEPIALVLLTGILGLMVGSFLNVVIYRLPIMIERSWQEQCKELLSQSIELDSTTGPSKTKDTFNLIYPRSRCPHCGHQITVLENIPLISYLWQRGRCTICHQMISPHYPLIEALSAVLAMVTAWQFGFGWPLGGALILTWVLIAAAAIDFETKYLFDDITIPFLWLGLLCNMFGLYTDIFSSLIGVMGGYLFLWSVNGLFKLVRHKEGIGAGDFKFLALLGAWMGWQALPIIILLSALVGSIVGIGLMITRKSDMSLVIPYGPYLAGAGWICLVWGFNYHTYLKWVGYPS